jgi:hypothetical protein
MSCNIRLIISSQAPSIIDITLYSPDWTYYKFLFQSLRYRYILQIRLVKYYWGCWCILPWGVTAYWRKEEQCLHLRELGKSVLQRVFWELTILNFIGRYALLNFAITTIIDWFPSSCRSYKTLCRNRHFTLKVYLFSVQHVLVFDTSACTCRVYVGASSTGHVYLCHEALKLS